MDSINGKIEIPEVIVDTSTDEITEVTGAEHTNNDDNNIDNDSIIENNPIETDQNCGKEMNYKNTHSSVEIDLSDPKYYFNRELSLTEFNSRVLAEAEDCSTPLLERLKFCAILSSNLDEFFMIRVAGLKNQLNEGVVELAWNGMTPQEQMEEIKERLIPLYKRQENVLINEIIPELAEHNVIINYFEDLDEYSKKKLEKKFKNNILPALTPLSLSPSNPFPRLISRSLNVAFVFKDKKEGRQEKQFAFLQIPSVLNRLIPMKWLAGHQFILIEQLIKQFAEMLFPGMHIITTHTFRVTRDADIAIAEDEAEDLISEIAGEIKKRKWGREAVRLEHSSNMPNYLSKYLTNALGLESSDVYILNRPLSMVDFMELYDLELRELKYKPFAPKRFAPFTIHDNTFDMIKKTDFIVHHPFDCFDTSVLKFIEDAAKDKSVAAIKITLYRTNRTSYIVQALKRAAENGISVTALVELKARFDEQNNIEWAQELEQSGAHVVYGVPGLKTHCKIAMVVRKESEKLRTYVHLATGNYNQITAKLYTDIGMFTADPDIATDAVHLFNHLTAYSHQRKWKKLIVAPEYLYDKTIELIEREIELHTEENPSEMIIKMNSLAHRKIIETLYKASQKGVKIKLLVRGICCLKPGVPGVSDNIEVKSVIGRFLEHSRIFYFKNGGKPKIFLSSGDWMSRNMHRRVEAMFPVESKRLRDWLTEWLHIYWNDNKKSWNLLPDGTYKKVVPEEGEEVYSAQEHFLRHIRRK
jgi:polyphosphate kinase